MRRPIYVILIVSGVLVPQKHKTISNHYAGPIMTSVSYIILRNTGFALKPLNVGNSVALRPCSHSYDTLCVPGNSRHAFNAIISYIAGQKW